MAEEPAPLGGGIVGGVDRLLHVASGLGQDLAHFPSHRVGQSVLPVHEQIADPTKDVPPGWGWHLRPALESSLGRGNGPIEVGRRRIGKATDQIAAVGGIPILEVGTGGGCNPVTSDEVLEGLGHGGNRWCQR